MPVVGDTTVRLRAELCAEDGMVTLETEAGTVFTSAYEQLNFDDWADSLRNQVHGSNRFGKKSEFRARAGRIARQMTAEASLDSLCQQVAEARRCGPGPVFLQIEVVDRELDNIPWEVLALPIERQLGNPGLCVYRTVGGEVTTVTPSDPPQWVLLVDSAPVSIQAVNFPQEAEAICSGLQAMETAGLVHVEPCENANYRRTHEALSRPVRAIHVAAHGSPGEVYLREGREHLPIGSKPFAEMFLQETPPAAVILSICDSSRGRPETPAVTRAIADAGVGSVLGMSSAITTQAALVFFEGLYQALGCCCSMIRAYAQAVARLRASAYPNSGFWSVPVLYSQDNVIPFPRTMSDPGRRYERLSHDLTDLKSEVSAVQPRDGWIAEKWRLETMDLRLDKNRLRRGLEELIEAVYPETRNGSRWAEQVNRTARFCLATFELVVEEADGAVEGNGSASEFRDSQEKFLTALEKLNKALAARLRFSA